MHKYILLEFVLGKKAVFHCSDLLTETCQLRHKHVVSFGQMNT